MPMLDDMVPHTSAPPLICRGRASSSRTTSGAAAAARLAAGAVDAARPVGRGGAVHMALATKPRPTSPSSASTARKGTSPRSARTHPPAIRLERTIRDLFGLEPMARPTGGPGSTTAAGASAIRSARRARQRPAATTYAFLPAEGESLHQIPVGPVHAGIIEPGHFRFTANGETVVRLEERLGYVHKGIEALMAGAPISSARASSRAASPATARSPMRSPSRAPSRRRSASRRRRAPSWLRALMAELERLANHFGDIGAICNDASFALMHAHCGILRERVLRAAEDLLRPSADDGPHRSGRRRRRSQQDGGAGVRDAASTRSGGASPSSSSSTTTPPRFRTAPSAPAS